MADRILVTGGAGYIGSHTAKALAAAGYEPVAFDSLLHGHEAAVRWGPLVRGDLRDRDLLAKTIADHRIAGVVHFAALTPVGESLRDPRSYFENNVAGSLSLLGAMRDRGVETIVFSSSCAIYGSPVRIPMDEDHPQAPITPYGDTKLAVERALLWYGTAYGLRWTALRYFNAAGADADGEIGEDHEPETHLIPLALAAAASGRPLSVFGTDYDTPDGTAIRDYVHVEDLAAAHVRALGHLRNGGASDAFNLGSGTGTSVREILDGVARVSGREVPWVAAPRRAGDPPVLVADAAKAERVLGWRTVRSDIGTILATAHAWHARAGGR
jgi:UDP-arabinose 4-epimerase